MNNDAAHWDARYLHEERLWSGKVNSLLESEVKDLKPARALDVGSGEGADAIWLASNGWEVTAVDISQVAISRAAEAAKAKDVEVIWQVSDIALITGEFDLVYAFYAVVPKSGEIFSHLLNLVAPGGTLLYVHHTPEEVRLLGRGPNFEQMMSVADFHARMPNNWQIEKFANILRPGSVGNSFKTDAILRARKPLK